MAIFRKTVVEFQAELKTQRSDSLRRLQVQRDATKQRFEKREKAARQALVNSPYWDAYLAVERHISGKTWVEAAADIRNSHDLPLKVRRQLSHIVEFRVLEDKLGAAAKANSGEEAFALGYATAVDYYTSQGGDVPPEEEVRVTVNAVLDAAHSYSLSQDAFGPET